MRRPRGLGRKSLLERFWAKVDKSDPSGCWLWLGARAGTGCYGVIWDGRQKRAHRIIWEILNGPIPVGLDLCHHCDNPHCVNPDHLFLGTRSDNNNDSVRKGRWNRPLGENHPKAKLTSIQVLEIREASCSQRKIAHYYGVSRAVIRQVLSGKAWSHVQSLA